MNQRHDEQFFALYQEERFEDQLRYYKNSRKEFTRAQTQAVIGSIILIFFAGAVGIAASATDLHWVKVVCLLIAAIFPIFSTALAAYSALYGFEQQAKLYQDTINNLLRARALAPTPGQQLTEYEFAQRVNGYVVEVEKIFQKEQVQWGQLAEQMKPPES